MSTHKRTVAADGKVETRKYRRPASRALAANSGDAGNAASTRERILYSSRRLLAERGFKVASMRDIAQAAGITPGAVYKHFASKADLLLEVANRALQSIPTYVQRG